MSHCSVGNPIWLYRGCLGRSLAVWTKVLMIMLIITESCFIVFLYQMVSDGIGQSEGPKSFGEVFILGWVSPTESKEYIVLGGIVLG